MDTSQVVLCLPKEDFNSAGDAIARFVSWIQDECTSISHDNKAYLIEKGSFIIRWYWYHISIDLYLIIDSDMRNISMRYN